ncbi:5-oxoprolinase subunit PxpB [Hymenobacter crusticola]|uniref:Kinase inhibitor n=1 Tax=Hymenobacter crusticola TaxID=1770526 RepID=A0A243WDJ7_9BACT|nr:5-oxoprolinase subunit PxpB [Hymenobacter crusticola]OUJ73682.1 kinase inhibitor [Hymenobacter crusticola]
MENLYPAPATRAEVQLYSLGESAVVVQFGDAIKRHTHHEVQALSAYLDAHPFPGFVEYVPAFTTVTVYYNPLEITRSPEASPYESVAETLRHMLWQAVTEAEPSASHVIEVPVCYGGKFGPDLAFVASHAHLSPEEVVALHTQPEYLVYMIGFAPGFPYLGGMSEQLVVPRKDKPRLKVPAGSVGIAGKQTGVYSIQTPGGWQLIGRTPLNLFTPHGETPSLLKAGDYIRFVSITEREYERTQQHES